MGLTLPTFLALCLVVFAHVYPNPSAYALLPLTLIAPGCLIAAIVLLIRKRQRLSHSLYRRAWAVILLAVLAGASAVILIQRG